MLERSAQNLYRAKHLWSQVDYQTEMQLAEHWLELTPNDIKAKNRVLEHLIRWFRYSEHEWPAGILNGSNGATETECQEFRQILHKARMLDTGQVYSHFLDQYEAKVHQYIDRLSQTAANKPTSNA